MLGGSLVILLNRRLVDLDALGLDNSPDLDDMLVKGQWKLSRVEIYFSLELSEINGAQSISLGNNRDQINSRAQSLHDLNIQRLQGVASGSDEVQTGVNTKVDLVLAAGLLLLKHVRLVLVVQELDDGHP